MSPRALLAACAALLILAPAAHGASTLGRTAPTPDQNCAHDLMAWNTAAPYVAPTQGVITQLRGTLGMAAGVMSLKVIRPSGPTVLGSTAQFTVTTPGTVASQDVRVPVQAGDALGMWIGTDTLCAREAPGTPITVSTPAPDQQSGAITSPSAPTSNFELAVAATMEPDVDGDEFGDETQDSCPTEPTVHEGACVVDAKLTATATPATIEVGDVSVVDMSVAAPGTSTVRGAALQAGVPSGLEQALFTPRSCAFAAVFTCSLGDFTGSREAALVVRGTAPGTYTVPVSLTTTSSDPNAADNAASVAITVKQGGSTFCVVPKLKGRTKAFAKALLKAAGCKLGTVKRKTVSKGRNGRVRSQTVKKGTSVPAGTKVGVTLNRRR
jgi:hypothetical protein